MKILEIEFIRNFKDWWFGQPELVRKFELLAGIILLGVGLFWDIHPGEEYGPVILPLIFLILLPLGLLVLVCFLLWKLVTWLIDDVGL